MEDGGSDSTQFRSHKLEQIGDMIWFIRSQRVIPNADLAALYGAATKAFNRAVKRNRPSRHGPAREE